eukprot:gene2667-2706_t
MAKNAIWIMCDQLRFDYLSCTGHPRLQTPNIDALAARGVRFETCYVQSTICGPSRMSAYTGRYVRSHGSTQNGVPLRIGEPTLGDHLREIGVRTVLAGKTHMAADRAGMARLGIDPASYEGVLASECGFEPFDRDDGLHPDGRTPGGPPYDRYLREHGFDAPNPWEHWANSGQDADGLQNGWLLVHGDKPARVPEQHSETPYMTRRAMEFIAGAEPGKPWCLHLSFIKPHWPYIAPAPYHDMYGPGDIVPPVRSEAERQDAHPVLAAFMQERYSRAFSRDEVRERVIPAYMGLIKQIDDQVGVLVEFLAREGLDRDTMIIFSSDHGDYLGDHWLGEKYMFHDASVRVPLIVMDPSPEADVTRGMVRSELVEMIDIAPTLLDFFGGEAKPHVLEGRSLMRLLTDPAPQAFRSHLVSEYDYSPDEARLVLGRAPSDCRMTMVADARWKLVQIDGFRPLLYDRVTDPDELVDLGGDPAMAGVVAGLEGALDRWARHPANRITVADGWFSARDDAARHFDRLLPSGVLIGYWDEAELEAERRKRQDYEALDAISFEIIDDFSERAIVSILVSTPAGVLMFMGEPELAGRRMVVRNFHAQASGPNTIGAGNRRRIADRFAQLGPIRAADQNQSGSAVLLALYRPEVLSGIRSIDAVFALHRRGMTLLKAKRAVEEVLDKGLAVAQVPLVEDAEALLADLGRAGFDARMLKAPDGEGLKLLRARLKMSRKQFALRYGLSVENVRNWEEDRRPMDSTARSYLAAIANDPNGIPLPYEEALRA